MKKIKNVMKINIKHFFQNMSKLQEKVIKIVTENLKSTTLKEKSEFYEIKLYIYENVFLRLK